MKTRTISAIAILFVTVLAVISAMPTIAAEASATRTFLTADDCSCGGDLCVDPSTVFTVQIEASGYGSFGEVAETLCNGWTYTGTSLQESQVNTDTQGVVKFYPWDDQTFTYTVQAPSTEGAQCVIDGTIKNATMHTSAVGGEADARVCTGNGGGDEASATRTFLTADDCSCGGDLCVAPSTVFTVQIEASGYGSFGEVAETLCNGWTYTGTSLQESQVNTDTQGVVKFYPWDDQTFTYTVQAPSTEGAQCVIDGTLMNATMHTFTVGGEDEICTCTSNVDPTVNIDSPVGVTVSGTIDVTATATDTDGTVTQVAFYLMPAGTLIDTPDTNGADGWSVPLDTTTVTDGDYQIKAVATDDGGATGDDTGGVFAIDNSCPCDFCLDLDAGWNLVSVPRMLDGPTDAKTVFNLSSTELCEYYNGCTGRWSYASPSAMQVTPGRGYMVAKASAETRCLNFDDSGTAIPLSQQLCADDWNMIGFSSLSSMSVADFGTVTALDGKFTMVWQWNSGWEMVSPPDSNSMVPGKGYLLWMTDDGVLPGMIA